MVTLNYHHLRYFHAVAHEGNLTRAAARLNLSQSSLSAQIRQLEERLGHTLFERHGRRLVLTEVGRIALDHADRIFSAGDDLMALLGDPDFGRGVIRIGAISTLSRNFQLAFVRPLIQRGDVEFVLRSGSETVLLDALGTLTLDVVLTTEPPPRAAGSAFVAQRLAQQRVGCVATADRLNHASLAELLAAEPVILPTESSIRTGFDALTDRLEVTPRIAAEVDDMAMVRLLAREGAGLAIAPAVVLADEIAAGLLSEAPFDLDIVETFYAVTIPRRFPNPLLRSLMSEGRLQDEGLPLTAEPDPGQSA
ncbi:MAG: LysR family transcriptional regulator [Pseudomonadota bacterium]